MALEKRSAREIEDLKSQNEDMGYEIQALRGGGPSPEVERLKTQLATATEKVEGLEASVAEKSEQVEAKAREVEEKTAELQSKSEEIERLSAAANDQTRVADLVGKIAILEGELDAARQSQNDEGSRQLQRELNAAQRKIEAKEREIEDLKIDLKEANEENSTLRSSRSAPVDDTRIADLESQLATAQQDLEAEREKVSQLAELEKTLETTTANLNTARDELNAARVDLSELQAQMEVSCRDVPELTNRRRRTPARHRKCSRRMRQRRPRKPASRSWRSNSS